MRRARDDQFIAATRAHLSSLTPGGQVCVVVIEIDHFEALTAVHGASVGAEVLDTAHTRVRDAVQCHLVTRIAEKGFALVVRQSALTGTIAEIGRRIQRRFDQPIATSIGDLPVTVNIGVSTADAGHASAVGPQMLLAQARAAVDAATRRPTDRVAEFDPAMRDHAVQTYRTEQHLRDALRQRSVSVNYQPIINLTSGRVVGVEALARWTDPRFGPVPPSLFIPIAETAGLINQLGQIVLCDAVRQGAEWNTMSGVDATITVNLSKHQLHDPTLVATVRSLLESHHLAGSRLCLEITESVAMADIGASMHILRQLKDLGVMFAIDDFGTGHSSLSYLKRLPVDILKIDRSFVHALANRDDRLITKAVIDLAHTLGMTTVAEGVETINQIETLVSLDCDMVQGFLLQEPRASTDVDFGDVDIASLGSSFNESRDLSFAP